MGKSTAIIFLTISNAFMTYAWYGHLKDMKSKPLFLVIIFSWSIAFLEYCFQVPANRIGSQFFSLAQLKIIQEIITMSVFALFSIFYMKQEIKTDFLLAGLCMMGAAYFMFRSW